MTFTPLFASMLPRLPTGELGNVLTHALGVVLSIIGGSGLIVLATRHGGAREIVGASVFVATLLLLYSASTLYHAAHDARARARWKVLDHSAIYLLIAGTYTPFTIAAVRGAWGWSLFGVIWALALAGIVFKLFFTGRFKRLSTAIYIGMGWLVVIAFMPLVRAVSTATLAWLFAGGVLYTAGTYFYHLERWPHAHAVWHLFVLGGSISHFIAVVLVVLPAV
ncbi:MAG: hemolysin III family protein [Wenzhouxiangellaceae bacterium]|nr:hemolysin III family protein [Wenzhouxiangellaceae bacterium]